jgi:ABC-type uncharacterized transport system involved in gliding motility auxiliary subunit
VVQSGERTQKIQQTTEQAVTGAILTVTRDTQPTVYFLTGHGERSLDGMDQTSYSEARRVLEEDNLTVQPISLVVSPTIPLENSVLVVADPQQPLQPREEQVIAEYVTRGGSLLLLSNPLVQAPLPTVMSAVGLTWNNDLVFDQQAELNNPFAPVVMDYPFSSITSDLAGEPTLFATVRTISQNQMAPAAGLTVTPLLRSSPDSQAASNFSGDQVQLDPNDPQGPLTFGFSVEGAITATQLLTGTVPADPTGRVVAIGDADFASNVYLTLPGIANRELFRSTVAWLATQDDEFTLPPREDPVDRSIFLTASTSNLVFYGSTFGLPLLVILAGVVVWWRRR